MNALSKLVPVLALLAVAAGCGGADEPSPEAAASTHACRAYELGSGADDQPIAKELTSVLTDGAGYEAPVMAARVRAVQAAAAAAGTTRRLPVKDFRMYRDVVQAALALEAQLVPASDTVSLDAETIAKFRDAASAVHQHCA